MSTLSAIDNAKTIGKIYDAFGRGDIPFIIDQLDDNCKWIVPGEGHLPYGGTYHGKDAKTFFSRLKENMDTKSFNVYSINEYAENELVAFGNIGGTSRKSGKEVSSEWAMRWKFNDQGKVIFFQDFFDTVQQYAADNK